MALADDVFMSSNHIVSIKSYNIYFYLKNALQYDFQYGLLQSTKFDLIYQFLKNFIRVQFCSKYIKIWFHRIYQWRKNHYKTKTSAKIMHEFQFSWLVESIYIWAKTGYSLINQNNLSYSVDVWTIISLSEEGCVSSGAKKIFLGVEDFL